MQHGAIKIKEDGKILMRDFEEGLKEIRPAFGVDEGALEQYLRLPFYNYGNGFDKLYQDLKSVLEGMVNNVLPVSTLLLHGDKGTGKTTLACKLAQESGIPFIKIISSDLLIGRTDNGKVNKIAEFFTDAYKSKCSLVI